MVAKKSAPTPKAAAAKRAAKIVKVKAELAKEVKMERRERTTRQKIDDAVERAADFVNPAPAKTEQVQPDPIDLLHETPAGMPQFTPPAVEPVEAPLVDASGKRLHFTADAPALLAPLIEAAWNRCRGEGDALYEACAPNFKEILHGNAISALKSGVVAKGDSPLEKFQAEIIRISRFQDSVTEFDGVNRRLSERRVHHKSVDPERRIADRRVVR